MSVQKLKASEQSNVVYIGVLVPFTENPSIDATLLHRLKDNLSRVKKVGKTSVKNFNLREESLGNLRVDSRGTRAPLKFEILAWWNTRDKTATIEANIQNIVLGNPIHLHGEWFLDYESDGFIRRVAQYIEEHYGFSMNTENPENIDEKTQKDLDGVIQADVTETEEIEKSDNRIVGYSIGGERRSHAGGRKSFIALFKELNKQDETLLARIHNERPSFLAREKGAFDYRYKGNANFPARVQKCTVSVGEGWYLKTKFNIKAMRSIVEFVSGVAGKEIKLI